jgi:glycosyltransferase involved in cell wall biosynthesis
VTRVMQVMAGAAHGGAEAFFDRLVPALARAGVEQRTVIRRNEERAARLRAEGLNPIELTFGGMLDFSTGPALRRAVDDFRPDVQVAWMSRAARFCRPNSHVIAGRMGGYYDLKYYRYCHHLIGNTNDIRDYIVRSGWPAENAWYLPNFVDATPMPAAGRASLDTPDDVPVLLALGRLHANKGFDILLAALQGVPRAVLWIGGVGPEEAALKQRAGTIGVADRVRFLGWRRDVGALMAAADLFVCSSRHEPLGNVVIEAWAHRIPVVAAASSGPAALIENRRSGLLVPVEDAPALAAAINAVLQDTALAATLVGAGYAAYSASYTESSVVAQYCDFFERVIR